MNYKKTFKQIINLISKSKNIVLTTHLIPDGDAIGCELAFYHYLKAKGKKVNIINHSTTPDNYKFLDTRKVIKLFRENKEKNIKLIEKADLIFLLDTNEYDRTKGLSEYITKAQSKKICIDHHLGNNGKLFDVYLSDTEVPATAILLYKLIKFDNEKYINKNVAVNLYAGIMTDTGSFRFPRTTAETFIICADLVKKGADPVAIYEETYNKLKKEKIKLLGKFIDSLTFHNNNSLAIGVITQQDLKNYNAEVHDIEGFSTVIMSIEGIKVGIVIVEMKNDIKCSFRSKGNINVRNFAKYFGGGGHKNAAGATFPLQNPHHLKNKLIKYYNKLLVK
ncbi:MAG: bifunctional oligoribonuclease/PAP phosphatase NrnA [Ignavibacteria bacterium]|nr:bifunctional oligoribonuclease/PAP phosphatase NrnA [Ignavibacteria bacterium]